MKLKHVFYLQAAALLLAATLWIFAPAAFYESSGLQTADPAWLLFGRNTGALLFGFLLIAFFAARAPDSPLRRQLGLSFFLLHLVSLSIYVVVWLLARVTNPMAIGLHVVFTLAFGYFQFFRSET